jgi:hypothetical protein
VSALPIHLIHHERAGRWAISWNVGNVVFVQAGFHFQARAIAAANDLCARLGLVPDFVR